MTDERRERGKTNGIESEFGREANEKKGNKSWAGTNAGNDKKRMRQRKTRTRPVNDASSASSAARTDVGLLRASRNPQSTSFVLCIPARFRREGNLPTDRRSSDKIRREDARRKKWEAKVSKSRVGRDEEDESETTRK